MTRLLFLLLLIASPVWASAPEPVVRVRIISTLTDLSLLTQSGWTVNGSLPLQAQQRATVQAERRHVRLQLSDGTSLRDTVLTFVPLTASGTMRIDRVPFGVGWSWQGAEDRMYEGTIRMRAAGDGNLSVVVELTIERYLGGVVPYEIGPDSPLEALKAQVVAARSESMVALATGMYRGDGFDICGDVECQVYGGIGRRTPAVERAIAETYGRILTDHGRPINAYYASNCGGHSEQIENVWPERSGPQPYWSAHPDGEEDRHLDLTDPAVLRRWIANPLPGFCNPVGKNGFAEWNRRHFRWTVSTAADSIASGLAPSIGRVIRFDSLRRGSSGRILRAVIVGERGSAPITDQLSFRKLWQPPLRSSCVIIESYGPHDRPEGFTVTGAGWGHGVGMCQTGAIGMALLGYDYGAILHHYYRGADIDAVY